MLQICKKDFGIGADKRFEMKYKFSNASATPKVTLDFFKIKF